MDQSWLVTARPILAEKRFDGRTTSWWAWVTFPEALLAGAYGVSADGSIVVGSGSSSRGSEAFRWQNDFMAGLGDLAGGSFDSRAWDVSADGSIVVGYGNSDDGREAFIWDSEHGMQSLSAVLASLGLEPELENWVLSEATAISADGTTIAGFGINPDGNTEAWIANLTPIPVPGAVWLLASGLICLVGLRKKYKR
jgi:probable HAF family extracellular repeat protein